MKTAKTLMSVATLLGGVLLAYSSGCQRDVNDQGRVTPATPPHPAGATELQALARLEPTQGNQVRGTVRFKTEGNGVRVSVDISGLTPGEHGFHVHENGDCSAPDAKSAGGHFDPTHQPHGARDAKERHVGDFGNLTADANGRAQLDFLDPNLKLSGADSIVGRAIIIHAGKDDLKSQPSGDSGARVACGKIELDRKNP